MSRLLLQIVYENGQVCRFPAGGPIEADLVEMLVTDLADISRWKTKAQYQKAMRQSIRQSLLNFKRNGRAVIV